MKGYNAIQERELRLKMLKASIEKCFNNLVIPNKAMLIATMGLDWGITAQKAQEYLKTLCTVYGWHDEGEKITREAQPTLKQSVDSVDAEAYMKGMQISGNDVKTVI
jgi:hypothetical protein